MFVRDRRPVSILVLRTPDARLGARTGRHAPAILRNAGHPAVPQGSFRPHNPLMPTTEPLRFFWMPQSAAVWQTLQFADNAVPGVPRPPRVRGNPSRRWLSQKEAWPNQYYAWLSSIWHGWCVLINNAALLQGSVDPPGIEPGTSRLTAGRPTAGLRTRRRSCLLLDVRMAVSALRLGADPR